ncbi:MULTISPECIES: VOC family protein [unclassified Brevibacterium]|uniref:VOC family protein n=1 Tax=unclassified Brevibacterium TaxID=2614124 RepID=UPI0010C772B8|nr:MULTISPECIES: VOC family protein [Actinomycetes]MCK1803023.1 VOC family protein [Brevibacterium sp. R8603A2]MCX0276848.1 VOC family protein [Nocardia zapadnayensis]QCP04255.1 VOC family protein [Brevibacterium sp. CS2]
MDEQTFPRLRSTVLDAEDHRGLAEFYRALLGWPYRPGDEPGGKHDGEFLILVSPDGQRLAFQPTEHLPRSTWPSTEVHQQLHLDFTVEDTAQLERHRSRALELGARQIEDGRADPDEPIVIFTDPAGHPFCIFVG